MDRPPLRMTSVSTKRVELVDEDDEAPIMAIENGYVVELADVDVGVTCQWLRRMPFMETSLVDELAF